VLSLRSYILTILASPPRAPPHSSTTLISRRDIHTHSLTIITMYSSCKMLLAVFAALALARAAPIPAKRDDVFSDSAPTGKCLSSSRA
jgi:hypothetical protein